MAVFLVVMLFGVVGGYQRFGGTNRLNLQGISSLTSNRGYLCTWLRDATTPHDQYRCRNLNSRLNFTRSSRSSWWFSLHWDITWCNEKGRSTEFTIKARVLITIWTTAKKCVAYLFPTMLLRVLISRTNRRYSSEASSLKTRPWQRSSNSNKMPVYANPPGAGSFETQ
jgi:hypothetical protein